MSAFFNYVYPCNGNSRNEKGDHDTRRNKKLERVCQNQRERINRPDCRMIVIVGIHELRSMVLLPQKGHVIEMRMHRCGVIVIASTGVNVLKWRCKECQHEGEARL